MKFLVDSLPYYHEDCPFDPEVGSVCQAADTKDCPRYWSKYKVCSEDNPHECEMLKEVSENE